MERHFTVSGFIVEGGRTALHWHRRLQLWLPPGGHIDPDEDPAQAVIREVREETGITAEIVPHQPPFRFSNVTQLPPPLSIIVADVAEGPHEHIDMVYALRPVPGVPRAAPEEHHDFVWLGEDALRRHDPLPVASCGVDVPIPEDVREFALAAIDVVRRADQRPGDTHGTA
jgi:8-oxo-dGTP pyrophosphatase MutT (NUDIX family)